MRKRVSKTYLVFYFNVLVLYSLVVVINFICSDLLKINSQFLHWILPLVTTIDNNSDKHKHHNVVNTAEINDMDQTLRYLFTQCSPYCIEN